MIAQRSAMVSSQSYPEHLDLLSAHIEANGQPLSVHVSLQDEAEGIRSHPVDSGERCASKTINKAFAPIWECTHLGQREDQ